MRVHIVKSFILLWYWIKCTYPLTSLSNIWGHITTVPACSSVTLTNVLPHRNAMPQTQDMTPNSVTVYRHGADLSLCYPMMWNVTLEYTTTHFNVLGLARSFLYFPHVPASAELYDALMVVRISVESVPPCRFGLVISVSASQTVGHGFVSRPGHNKGWSLAVQPDGLKVRVMYGTVYGDTHLNVLLGSILRVIVSRSWVFI